MLPYFYITGTSCLSEPCPFNQSDVHSRPSRLHRREVLKDKPRFGAFFDFILTAAECALGEQQRL